MAGTILVTGGAGYIGGHTVLRMLQQAELNIVLLDQVSDKGFNGTQKTIDRIARMTEIPYGSERFQGYDGDVGDAHLLGRILAAHRIDACIDFAALIEAGTSMHDPEEYFNNNVAKFYTLAEVLYRGNVPRIIKSSTAAAFGDMDPAGGFTEERVLDPIQKSALDPADTNKGKLGGEDLHQYLMELTRKEFSGNQEFLDYVSAPEAQTRLRHPVNVYGWTKVMNELTLEYFAEKFGKDFVELRYFNAWGVHPGLREDHDPETHLIPLAMDRVHAYHNTDNLAKSQFLSLFGTDFPTPDRTCIRDYIHVVDLADAHIAALGAPAGAYNLGTGTGTSNAEMMKLIALGAGVPLVYLKKDQRGDSYDIARLENGRPALLQVHASLPEKALVVVEWDKRPGDPPALFANPDKALQVLGWQARIRSSDKKAMHQVYESRPLK